MLPEVQAVLNGCDQNKATISIDWLQDDMAGESQSLFMGSYPLSYRSSYQQPWNRHSLDQTIVQTGYCVCHSAKV